MMTHDKRDCHIRDGPFYVYDSVLYLGDLNKKSPCIPYAIKTFLCVYAVD